MFVYKKWVYFCKELQKSGYTSIPACDLIEQKNQNSTFIVLKHDVETNVKKAYKFAKIENRYSHRGSYYVQAYLLKKKKNIEILQKIQSLGHEVTYHHDVMDSSKGNLLLAEEEFEKNNKIFEKYGFKIKTVCQHGNPVITRVGYYSNRDFFRAKKIQVKYSTIYDIMVNFRKHIYPKYIYISDAGYGWKIIHDPETNDITPSDNKNISLKSLFDVIELLNRDNSIIVSTHPHRWQPNYAMAILNSIKYRCIKILAKILLKMPFLKHFFDKYYALAKKI